MDLQFVLFFETAIKAQKQTVNEAWKEWKKKPCMELYPDGFKDFLIEFLNERVKEIRLKVSSQK